MVQCLMSASDFRQRMTALGSLPGHQFFVPNLYFKKIMSDLNRFHRETAPWLYGHQAYADKRIKALDDVEHTVYRWLNLIKDSDELEPERKVVMKLLEEIQEAHIEMVDYIHTKNLKLYTPDRGQLSQSDQRSLDEAWDELRKGSGMVKFSSDQSATQSNKELRSIHARLLSRPHGRGLMSEILKVKDDEPFSVLVKYTPAYTSTKEKRTAIAQNRKQMEEYEKLRKKAEEELLFWQDSTEKFEQANQNWGATYRERKLHLMQAHPPYRLAQVRMEELMEVLNKVEGELVKFGDADFPDYALGEPDPALAGGHDEGSLVTLRTGLTDNTERNFDKAGRYIPAPAFIIYGHELVHVLQRRYPKQMILDPLNYPKTHPKGSYHNSTERETIRSLKKHREDGHIKFYENLLREEHGVTARKGHSGKSLSEIEGR